MYVDEQISWQGFASGQVDVVLENWGHPELIDLYVKKLKVAQDAGSIGITGVIGWYVPPWMKKKYPDITNWKNLNKYADLFKTSESGGKGQLLDGDPGFVTNDEALVKNLDLNYKVVFAGSEAALIQAFRSGGEEQEAGARLLLLAPVVPRRGPAGEGRPAALQGGLRRRPRQGRLRLPAVPLHKIVATSSWTAARPAYKLVKNFKWSNKDQNLVAKYITSDGMTPEDAAQKWIDDNPDKVDAWLRLIRRETPAFRGPAS